jgi:hypothetical protein
MLSGGSALRAHPWAPEMSARETPTLIPSPEPEFESSEV